MVGVAFGQCGRFQQCRLRNDFRVDGRDGEAAFWSAYRSCRRRRYGHGPVFPDGWTPFMRIPLRGCTSYAGEKKVSGMDTTEHRDRR